MSSYIGLADCNSFFASCERVFRPDLIGKPIVVLSNNDGCIVALSKEAKELGITRGAPYFKEKEKLEKNHVAVFSSNYALYQNLSDRVMEMLMLLTGDIEIYSIDECFFHPEENNITDAEAYIALMAKYLRQGIGIPVSIGLARTKTLAKIANHIAKKNKLSFFLRKEDEEYVLKKTSIDDIWGIGYRTVPKLISMGITTAWDFASLDDDFLLKHFTVCGYNTAMELRGKQVIGREVPANLSVSSSISFSTPQTELSSLQNALACHCTTVCHKLFKINCKAESFAVQILNNRFHEDFKNRVTCFKLQKPSDYLPDILGPCQKALKLIYEKDVQYKSMRIVAWDLTRTDCLQKELFNFEKENEESKKKEAINRIMDKTGIYCASTCSKKKQELANRKMLSPNYMLEKSLAKVGLSDSRYLLS